MEVSSLPTPPIHLEARAALELRALLGSRAWRGEGLSRGDGEPVLLIPGFLAGDMTLRLMAGWLERLGYRPMVAGIRANVECSEGAVGRLEERLAAVVREAGTRALIVGHSRGGMLGRVLAVRRPDLVAGIVSMGTPYLATLEDLHPVLQRQIETLAQLGDRGRPVLTNRCRIGAPGQDAVPGEQDGCCEAFWRDLRAPLPAGVGFASIYSSTDGIVRWTTCLDPAAEAVPVSSSHCGMAINPRVYREVAKRLRAFAHPASAHGGGVRGVVPLALSPTVVSTPRRAA
jgi:pimeloyl-ACP methyl ester carboxylesterase